MLTANRLYDLRWGVSRGLALALVYAAYATFLRAIRGNEPFEKLQVSYQMVVVGYLCAGLVGGAVVGLLRPMTDTRRGANLVGALAGVLAVTPIGAMLGGSPARWDPFQLLVVLIVGVVMGTFVLGPELLKSAKRVADGL